MNVASKKEGKHSFCLMKNVIHMTFPAIPKKEDFWCGFLGKIYFALFRLFPFLPLLLPLPFVSSSLSPSSSFWLSFVPKVKQWQWNCDCNYWHMLKDLVSIMKLSIVYYSRVEVTFNHVLTQLSSENNNKKRFGMLFMGTTLSRVYLLI